MSRARRHTSQEHETTPISHRRRRIADRLPRRARRGTASRDNGRRSPPAATRTWVARSPTGRVVTTTLDTLGRVVFEQVDGLTPATYTYDPRGRPRDSARRGDRGAPQADGRDRRAAGAVAHPEELLAPRHPRLRDLPRLPRLRGQGVLRQLLPAHRRRHLRPARKRPAPASGLPDPVQQPD